MKKPLSCKCITPYIWYSHKYDAKFCMICLKWLESKCGAKTKKKCPFECWKRPKTVSLEGPVETWESFSK